MGTWRYLTVIPTLQISAIAFGIRSSIYTIGEETPYSTDYYNSTLSLQNVVSHSPVSEIFLTKLVNIEINSRDSLLDFLQFLAKLGRGDSTQSGAS